MIKIKWNNKTTVWLVRIILTLLCILMIAWIFSNSLKTGVQSAEQSAQVTEGVKDAIETIKPDVEFGGSSEQENFDILHSFVRNFAHFGEFALLCALCTWCVLSYTAIKWFFLIPVPFCVGVAFFDEYLQTFSDGRAQELADVMTDSLGACTGFVFALLTIWLACVVVRLIQKKKNQSDGDRYEPTKENAE